MEDETILGSMISRITVIASLGDHKSHSGKIITLKKHINGQRKIDCTRPRNGDDIGDSGYDAEHQGVRGYSTRKKRARISKR